MLARIGLVATAGALVALGRAILVLRLAGGARNAVVGAVERSRLGCVAEVPLRALRARGAAFVRGVLTAGAEEAVVAFNAARARVVATRQAVGACRRLRSAPCGTGDIFAAVLALRAPLA